MGPSMIRQANTVYTEDLLAYHYFKDENRMGLASFRQANTVFLVVEIQLNTYNAVL